MAVLEEQGQIQIHTENIFPIIKKAVYSGHEVFLRELVSNGVDAISYLLKLQLLHLLCLDHWTPRLI